MAAADMRFSPLTDPDATPGWSDRPFLSWAWRVDSGSVMIVTDGPVKQYVQWELFAVPPPPDQCPVKSEQHDREGRPSEPRPQVVPARRRLAGFDREPNAGRPMRPIDGPRCEEQMGGPNDLVVLDRVDDVGRRSFGRLKS
jgi:hypothetical protein